MYSSRLEPIKQIADKSQEALKAEAASGFHGDNTGKIHCPRCRVPMLKQDVRLPGLTMQIDVCRACSLIWLDGGELALAQLGHEAKDVFADAQELKRKMEKFEASPGRKAAFEEKLAQMPNDPDTVDDAVSDVAMAALAAIIRGGGI